MAFLEWLREYEIGHEQIDAQHRHLVDMVNNLHVATIAGEGVQVLAPVLKELVDYVREHFRAEEQLAASFAPEECALQRAAHAKIVKRLKEVIAISRSAPQRASVELTSLLKAWVIKHVLVVDKRLAQYLPSGSRSGKQAA